MWLTHCFCLTRLLPLFCSLVWYAASVVLQSGLAIGETCVCWKVVVWLCCCWWWDIVLYNIFGPVRFFSIKYKQKSKKQNRNKPQNCSFKVLGSLQKQICLTNRNYYECRTGSSQEKVVLKTLVTFVRGRKKRRKNTCLLQENVWLASILFAGISTVRAVY